MSFSMSLQGIKGLLTFRSNFKTEFYILMDKNLFF